MIDPYKRYQTGLSLNCLYPSIPGVCACGCGQELPKRKRKWYDDTCRNNSLYQFYIIKGDTSVIRHFLFKEDLGFCRCCGQFDENWQADHIIPVSEGGGGCTIDNFQTLCVECHKEKTKNQAMNNRYETNNPYTKSS